MEFATLRREISHSKIRQGANKVYDLAREINRENIRRIDRK